MKSLVKYCLILLILAFALHVITLWAYPYVIMSMVNSKMLERSGGEVNKPVHYGLITPKQRTVVMPSTDLIYSSICFDVSDGALLIKALVPPDTYWSLAFYGSNTDNFYHINDRQADKNPVDILLLGSDTYHPKTDDAKVIVSPSKKGVILARLLVKDSGDLDDLVKIQKQLSCKVIQQKDLEK